MEATTPAATPAAGPERPYHSKRPHRKSRAGCRNCKTRKVKCNEAKPTCQACTLRREKCVYPASQAGAVQPVSNAASSSSPSSSSSPNALLPRHLRPGQTGSSPPGSSCNVDKVAIVLRDTVVNVDVNEPWTSPDLPPSPVPRNYVLPITKQPLLMPDHFDGTDMRLMWFYTTNTYGSFASNAGRWPHIDEILKVRVVQHAFNTPFLMSSLLSLSALHVQFLKADEALKIPASKALYYRASAFEGYRRAIEEAKPETFPALLACSLLLCAVSTQAFREPTCPPLYILDYLVVWRGIGLIVELISKEALIHSGIAALFFRPPIDLEAAARHIPSSLVSMVDDIPPTDPDFAVVDVYRETLKYLGSLYQELKSGISPTLELRVCVFFTFLPRPFVDLCRQRRPRAMVVIAYWLAFSKLVTEIWWMTGIGDRELPNIADALSDRQWSAYIQPPLAAMLLRGKTEIAKVLLEDPGLEPKEVGRHDIIELYLTDQQGRDLMTEDGEFRFPNMRTMSMRPRSADTFSFYEALNRASGSESSSASPGPSENSGTGSSPENYQG